jgi:sensor histidine kinase YesM
MAVEYVEQLSDFFRNIVTYRDKDIITLKEELRLLQTYLFIQKKRFGNNLELVVNVSNEDQLHSFIPPLTLQLLAENAIKHNAVSKETPLTIHISIKNECIVVSNNINTRISKAEGAGMGLQNIVNRYNLLSKKSVIIKNDTIDFVVSLPTLKKQV